MPSTFTSRRDLELGGFIGFESVAALRSNRGQSLPDDPGVYMVVRELCDAPVFLAANPGGRFKDRDPTVSPEVIQAAWVDKAVVLYIGQAGGGGSSATLRKRLVQLLDFGAGKPIGHWGGRYLWQLEGMDSARVCWRTCRGEDPSVVESALIQQFVEVYGKRPFANLRG